MKKKYKIAITGVGGGVGQSIIKALSEEPYKIIGLDGELLATGLYATDESFLIPYARDPIYISSLLKLCQKENIDILFPGLDSELPYLAMNTHRFNEIGTTVIISDPEVISLCDDKYATNKLLSKMNLPCPKTLLLNRLLSSDNNLLQYPIIIKPRHGGARSLNVYKFSNKRELKNCLHFLNFKPEEFVAQEYIEGDEYTCSGVYLGDNVYGPIVMKRILRDGDTYKCFVEENSTIYDLVVKVLNKLKPFGSCNIQLRMKNNIPYIFEINARCSGTTAARAIAGFNEPKIIADYLLFGIKPTYNIKMLTILRYWKELPVYNQEIDDLRREGKIVNKWLGKL